MRPLRICFVNSMRTFGGAEVWILDAARGLRARGHKVSVIAQPGTPLLERTRAAHLPCGAIPIRFDGAPWTLWKLARFFKRQRIEAVLCNLTKDLKAAGLAARCAGVPVILALRESDFALKGKVYYRWYFGRVATGIVVNSRATRTTILASAPWLDPRRLHLLYKGVDLDRFQPAPQPPVEPIVGFVGQLIERKGLADLMKAWDALEARSWRRSPRLLVAGEGPWAADLERWRRTLRRPEMVELLGYVERIERFMSGLTILALPSRQEGFGLAAAEASACGVPVVACRASSLPEVIQEGQSGLLVPPRDPDALAAAIGRLLEDPDLCRRLGQQGREYVGRTFGRETMFRLLEALCSGLEAS